MQDQLISSAPLAPHTADIAELLAADRKDLADRVHELVASSGNGIDYWMAGALLEVSWEQVSPDDLLSCNSVQLTIDFAEMVAAGEVNEARDVYEAYVKAVSEAEDQGDDEDDRLDIWMAGALLARVWEQAEAQGAWE